MEKIKKQTFVEIVDHYSSQIILSLMENGGKGVRNTMWLALNHAIDWDKDRLKDSKNKK